MFEGAKTSPLAKKLFQIDGVSGIFFGSDYITVNITVLLIFIVKRYSATKDGYNWTEIKPLTFSAISDFYASGAEVIKDGPEVLTSNNAIIFIYFFLSL